MFILATADFCDSKQEGTNWWTDIYFIIISLSNEFRNML